MRNDVVKYVNSQGQEQFLSKGNCLCNTKALREFLYTVQNKRLYSNRQKTIVIELLFHGLPTDRDKIIDILEVDSILNTYGRLFVNDWYILCRFVGIQSISKEGYNNIRMDLQFVADTIEWSKATTQTFYSNNYSTSAIGGYDYPSDYPSDYSGEQNISLFRYVNNNELAPADFIYEHEMTNGATSVSFYIQQNGQSTHYSVDLTGYTFTAGDLFVIDSEKKIVGFYHEGEFVSAFASASDTSYIFEKIKTGVSKIFSTNFYPKTLFTLIQHRRQPRWMI